MLQKQGTNIKTMCPNYILELRNSKLHLSKVYLDQDRNYHPK